MNKTRHIFTRYRLLRALVLVLCVILLAGCRSTSPASSAASAPQSQIQADTNGSKEPFVMIEITMENGGVIKLELDRDAAPITVENFVSLVNDGFYDGLTFHRLVDGFMIQGGCPNGTGTGGPGHHIKGEFAANGWDNPISHTRGVISMARSGDPDSAGSQFFIMHGDNTGLDGQYAAFGRVVDGMDAVDAIVADTPTEWNANHTEKSVPTQRVGIESIRVVD